MARQLSMFGQHYTMHDSIELTLQSLRHYGSRYAHWVVAYSGGKDSSTTATLTAWAIETGQVPAPESLLILTSDTRMEIPPLVIQARKVLAEMRRRGFETRTVEPPMDKRFWNYMLGRGVPPPGASFRWCTGQLKIEPQMQAVKELAAQYGEKMLVITGVRRGESAERDARIENVCSKDGECGLGMWLGPSESAPYATLAPLLHWRTCHVWDWLMFEPYRHGFPTEPIADIYGGEEQRTGCIACPVASRDDVLENVARRLPEYAHLAPLLELRVLWDDMRDHRLRKRKQGERNAAGRVRNRSAMRFGPLTMEARAHFLDRVLDIQNRAGYELITAEDEAFIRQCWADNVWPDKWTGREVDGTALVPLIFDGAVQPLMEGCAA